MHTHHRHPHLPAHHHPHGHPAFWASLGAAGTVLAALGAGLFWVQKPSTLPLGPLSPVATPMMLLAPSTAARPLELRVPAAKPPQDAKPGQQP